MTTKTESVSYGRGRMPKVLAAQFKALPPGLRGRTITFIIRAHTDGLDLKKLVAAADQLRRLGVLLNQSIRIAGGRAVDVAALQEAVTKINELWS